MNAGTPHGTPRRRDRLIPSRFRSSRSRSPAAAPSSSQASTTTPIIPLSSNVANQASSSVAQPPSTPPSSSAVQPLGPSSTTSNDLLAAALRRLPPRELQILQPCIHSANDDIQDVVKQSLVKAREKKAECEAKRWTFTLSGRSFVLKEEADKMMSWLNRFKAVGDVAVNVDPVHAGLAWAGVRFLLEVLVSEANAMASLLIGCNTVLYMTHRLDAYLAFWHTLPDSILSKPHLKDAITEMYACVLGFLAQAIETYQQSGIKRALNSFWQESDVQDFETRCNACAERVENQATSCDRVLREKDSIAIGHSYQDLQRVLQELQQIHTVQIVVDRIERKIDLQGLRIVREALFDADAQKHTGCHPSTREALLQQVRDWASAPDSKPIFWLQGMAGMGKSTISWTLSDWLCSHAPKDEVQLGATFFFDRRENDRASAQFLFPTIIHQLAQKVPGLDALVAQAVRENPDISSKNSAEKFKVLIRQPFQQLTAISGQPVYVIVLDALDECRMNDTAQAQRLLSELSTFSSIRLRIFLTSRPEIPIQQAFRNLSSDVLQVVVLDEVPRPVIRQDISAYLRAEFLTIRAEFNDLPLVDEPLPESWPGEKVLRDLTDMAVPLFIVAATIHRFVYGTGSLQSEPRERLAKILQSSKLGHMSALMQIYFPVLGYLTPLSTEDTDFTDNEELCKEFRMIIGAIITLAEPLSRKTLTQLLNLPSAIIARHLRPLYSVLRIPSDADVPVRILHLSFAEFLNNPKISNRSFAVDSMATHDMLFNKCIELLSRQDSQGLRENMCHLKFPGQPRHDLSPAQVDAHLPPEMKYACRYWVLHAQQGKHEIRDDGTVHTFFRQHFLHWLEAMSLMGSLTAVVKQIKTLQLLVTQEGSSHIENLLEDARRFILANRHICEQVPLQLYSSSLIFAPWKSIIREECSKMPGWVTRTPYTPVEWGTEVQILQGHTGEVNAVAFSHDGALLASASWDRSIRLWDVSTGQEVQKLEKHTDHVTDVIFASLDSSMLVSLSRDSTVHLWDVGTGDEVQRFEVANVRKIACSPDKILLACASGDTILLWKTATGQEICKLHGDSDIRALTFSADGTVLASGSRDAKVRIWNLRTGQCVHNLDGHIGWVQSLAFSPNDVLALGSSDHKITLWNADTGQVLRMVEGHTDSIFSVTFSSGENAELASAADDGTVRVWNTDTGQEMRRLRHPSSCQDISFSPDGAMIALASDDGMARIWTPRSDEDAQQLSEGGRVVRRVMFSPDASLLAVAYDEPDFEIRLFDVNTGDEVQILEDGTERSTALVFSDDSKLLATGSEDGTMRLWSTGTGQMVRMFQGHAGGIHHVMFLHDGMSIASTSGDYIVRIWDTSTGQLVQEFMDFGDEDAVTSKSRIGCVATAFSPDGDLLAFATDSIIRLWSTSTGQRVQEIRELMGSIWKLAFSFSNAALAVGLRDGTVLLWNVSTGQRVRTFRGHEWWINALAFDPDDDLLASASDDNTIRLWDVSTGQQLQKLEMGRSIFELKFSSDKSALITDRGCIRTGLTDTRNAETSSHAADGGDIFVTDDWVQYRGQNLLWLPPDYRNADTKGLVVQGNVVAMIRADREFSILKFDMSAADWCR